MRPAPPEPNTPNTGRVQKYHLREARSLSGEANPQPVVVERVIEKHVPVEKKPDRQPMIAAASVAFAVAVILERLF